MESRFKVFSEKTPSSGLILLIAKRGGNKYNFNVFVIVANPRKPALVAETSLIEPPRAVSLGFVVVGVVDVVGVVVAGGG